jgi:hypothetical protein
MASLSKKIVNDKPYYYLRESKRVNGKPKIVRTIYLGSAESIKERLLRPKVEEISMRNLAGRSQPTPSPRLWMWSLPWIATYPNAVARARRSGSIFCWLPSVFLEDIGQAATVEELEGLRGKKRTARLGAVKTAMPPKCLISD